MKILSWNVNWIRAVIQKGFFDWVKENNADIICLQEVKAFEIQMPSEVRFHLSGYDYLWHKWTRPGYAGTAIFFKKWMEVIEKKSDFSFHEFSDEGRVTEVDFKYWENVMHLLNVYFPNGWDRADGTEMLLYKLDFYDSLFYLLLPFLPPFFLTDFWIFSLIIIYWYPIFFKWNYKLFSNFF